MFIAIFVFVGLVVLIFRQQRTIDRLTDKLMAKDYGEYKRHTSPLMREEPKTRKPQSFYDDPGIEVEDDNVQ